MSLDKRLTKLESQVQSEEKGCGITVFIVKPQHDGSNFNSDEYQPAPGELEKYIETLRSGGKCEGCTGGCTVRWESGCFFGHEQMGVVCQGSWIIYVTHEDSIPLTRRLMNGDGR